MHHGTLGVGDLLENPHALELPGRPDPERGPEISASDEPPQLNRLSAWHTHPRPPHKRPQAIPLGRSKARVERHLGLSRLKRVPVLLPGIRRAPRRQHLLEHGQRVAQRPHRRVLDANLLSDPHMHQVGARVDLPHEADVGVALRHVRLVDAQRVHPDAQRLDWLATAGIAGVGPDPAQRPRELAANGDADHAVAIDRSGGEGPAGADVERAKVRVVQCVAEGEGVVLRLLAGSAQEDAGNGLGKVGGSRVGDALAPAVAESRVGRWGIQGHGREAADQRRVEGTGFDGKDTRFVGEVDGLVGVGRHVDMSLSFG